MQDDDNRCKDAGPHTQAEKTDRRSGKSFGEAADLPPENRGKVEFAGMISTKSQGTPRGKRVASKTELGEQIGVRLRSIYDDVLAQPVPERFLELLRQLEGNPTFAPAKKGET